MPRTDDPAVEQDTPALGDGIALPDMVDDTTHVIHPGRG